MNQEKFFSLSQIGRLNGHKGLGCIVVDESQRVVSLSALARQQLGRGGLLVLDDRLCAEHADDQRDLLRALDLDCLTRVRTPRRLQLRRLGHGHLYVTVQLIWLRAPGDRRLAAHAMLLLRDPEWTHPDEVTEVSEVFGLTRREGELACFIAQGHQLSDFAAAYGVTVNTAKSHLKQVYRKLGIKNQVQLVASVLGVLR